MWLCVVKGRLMSGRVEQDPVRLHQATLTQWGPRVRKPRKRRLSEEPRRSLIVLRSNELESPQHCSNGTSIS